MPTDSSIKKQLISQQRDAAVVMDIGSDGDAIDGFFQFDGRLLIIKPQSIFEVKLADSFDPDRNTLNIPNTNQRIFSIGSSNIIICRTLLTARELLKAFHLPKSINVERALSASFEVTSELVSLFEEGNRIKEQIRQEIDAATASSSTGSSLPSIKDLSSRCKYLMQRAHHTLQNTMKVTSVFYNKEIGQIDALSNTISTLYEDNDPFRNFIDRATPLFHLIWYGRNSVEHGSPTQRFNVSDFSIKSNGNLAVPKIEIRHPKIEPLEIDVVDLIDLLLSELPAFFEHVVAYLCSKHVEFQGFEIAVGPRPETNPPVRFCYLMRYQDGWVPLG